MKKIKVRKAELSDAPNILKLCVKFHQSSLYKNYDLSQNKLLGVIQYSISGEAFCWVIEEGSNIIGFMMGCVDEHWFGKDRIANDLAIYLLPNKRKYAFSALTRLITQFEKWAVDQGAAEVCVATSSGTDTKAYQSFLNRKGYTTIGYLTKKELTNVRRY